MTDQPSTPKNPAGLPLDEAERLGQLGFEAYRIAVANQAHNGQPIPPWEKIPRRIQLAWSYAATAIALNRPASLLIEPQTAETATPDTPATPPVPE
jgi:hypothetical protein